LKSEAFGGIHLANRAQIVDDLFQLARAGYLTYDFIFEILAYVKAEREFEPWYAMLTGLNYLQTRITDDRDFEAYVRDLIEPIYSYLVVKEDKSQRDQLNWIRVFDWACKYGVKDCQNYALDRFDRAAQNLPVDPNDKQGVLCVGLRETRGNFNFFFDKFIKSNYATEQALILTALGCVSNQNEINQFLDAILTDDIRLQDKSAAYQRAYTGNLENVDFVLDYITKNHEEWSKVMSLTSTLSDLASRFTRDDQVEKLDQFIKSTSNLPETTVTSLEASVTRAKTNIEWDKVRLQEVRRFFRGANGGASAIYVSFIFIILSAVVVRLLN